MLKYLPPEHGIFNISPSILQDLVVAQTSTLTGSFADAEELLGQACRDLGLEIDLENASLPPLQTFADLPLGDMGVLIRDLLMARDAPLEAARDLVERVQLLLAFSDPNEALTTLEKRLVTVLANFPRSASDIERGRNRGDVLDPFLVAATGLLLYAGDIKGAIEATVAHKAMMMIEDLAGHLHEDVIGAMRGNVRAPEPQGTNKEEFSFEHNAFPGADIVQPPGAPGERLRVFQVKSKTGSAKGGDAKRIADQLERLRQVYAADIFFCSVVGDTLAGHRSKGGLLRAAPNLVVATGQVALELLTGRRNGGELLLRVYESAFRRAAATAGYRVNEVAGAIVEEFARHETFGEDGMENVLSALLTKATKGDRRQQDSRTYRPYRRNR